MSENPSENHKRSAVPMPKAGYPDANTNLGRELKHRMRMALGGSVASLFLMSTPLVFLRVDDERVPPTLWLLAVIVVGMLSTLTCLRMALHFFVGHRLECKRAYEDHFHRWEIQH